ncbi:MAG: tRNA (adenosine(37)-N6)-threonylcarbamoyltransferase complex transferase subunit TsaD [Patescibacteria group bacterium]|nr:tRNA (adenosine(37)-N6)-threonylcarbamoyltransferase complex transferase subunit TsaD [Patescibacteria group bacterium]
MIIWSIETSCDETAIAVVKASGGLSKPKFEVLTSVVSSQIAVHRPFGGVVPNLAKREHLKNLPILLQKLAKEGFDIKKADTLAVTVGPGLEPALWTGVNFAKELAKKYKKPLIGVNHLEGHIYSFLLSKSAARLKLKDVFPAVALLVSGGHTLILKMDSLTKWKKMGETRDDAVGEAYDKVARLLDLPYPGGPEIEKASSLGNGEAVSFPRPMIDQKNYDFSFSGLKTAVLYYLRDHPVKTEKDRADAAASFEEAAVEVLVKKTMRAAMDVKAKAVIISGGVAANKRLREELKSAAKKNKIKFFAPEMKFNTDNAAMVAAAAYLANLRGRRRRITAQANLTV